MVGRKKGSKKTGGRQKGSVNKSNALRQAAIEASGETPMDYMLRVMRDPSTTHDRRDRMAAQAAPYVHAKLASIVHTGKDGGPIEIFERIRGMISDGRIAADGAVDAGLDKEPR